MSLWFFFSHLKEFYQLIKVIRAVKRLSAEERERFKAAPADIMFCTLMIDHLNAPADVKVAMLLERGQFLLQNGKTEEALADYERVLALRRKRLVITRLVRELWRRFWRVGSLSNSRRTAVESGR